ncbi:AI-2E family transporter [Jeongeupia chitinilytica]|uniref:AI-2E family transporter n=1 Tax=Jeongeupia chitinilytica TaxID=1041641 RepID=A0ABQ3H2R5_9NEIS|nr:AI-2E family transporter [Jeongeupia chitinilytica]
MFIKFGLFVVLAVFCYGIFAPFLTLMLWALVLAVTLYPLQRKLAHSLGRQWLAATVLVLAGLLLVAAPTVAFTSSIGDSITSLVMSVRNNTVHVPQPPERLEAVPIIGKKIYIVWQRASTDLPGLIQSQQPKIGNISRHLLSLVASMGGDLLKFIVSFIVAGVIMSFGEAGARISLEIANRIAGPARGEQVVRLCTATIRAVAQGVIGVAFIQALLVGVICYLAGVPAVGTFFVVALILGIAQVPVILATAPAIAWLWLSGDGGTVGNVLFTIALLVAGMSDNVLKPLLLGRGVDAPMPVILLGALGGMVGAGILGMFVGATALAIGYQLFMAWVRNGAAPVVAQNPDDAG